MNKNFKSIQSIPGFYAFGPSTHQEILDAETKLNLHFAEEYKTYLSAFGTITANGHEITGLCSSPRLNVVTVTEEERAQNPAVPQDWYVVEQTNIDRIVIWQNEKGELYQISPNQAPIKLADSLIQFLC